MSPLHRHNKAYGARPALPIGHHKRQGKANRIGWFAVIAVSALLGCRQEPIVSTESLPLQVVIDFNGRGENKQFQIEWRPDITAFECLESLKNQGKLTFGSQGSGSQTFVNAIDGLENLRAAGDNWVYTVNEKLGDRSSAVFKLQPGDRLTWRFGKYSVE